MNKLTYIDSVKAETLKDALNDYLEPMNMEVSDIADEIYLDNTICIDVVSFDTMSFCKYADEHGGIDITDTVANCVAECLDKDYEIVDILESMLPKGIEYCFFVG